MWKVIMLKSQEGEEIVIGVERLIPERRSISFSKGRIEEVQSSLFTD
jgi:hypothetical protein